MQQYPGNIKRTIHKTDYVYVKLQKSKKKSRFRFSLISWKRFYTEVTCSVWQVQFEVADATKRVYPDNFFDVVYSRDTILHIKDKLDLFKRFCVSYMFYAMIPFNF